jgi:hypothetical protein
MPSVGIVAVALMTLVTTHYRYKRPPRKRAKAAKE